jgi:tyrosyl-tRNA synthetase
MPSSPSSHAIPLARRHRPPAKIGSVTDLLTDLEARGLVQDTTDRSALGARLAAGPVRVYHGIDPTADSLHVGNLIGLLMLRRFVDAGHHPFALAGGATGMIGDPSGRSDERNLLDADTLGANVAAIKEQIGRILGDSRGWDLVDNLDWTAEIRLLDFLRDVGKHATVNQMVGRESVRTRMEGDSGISYTEFSYMLLQANDYWWLHEHRDVELQVGGSDQWGNILAGVDLIRRRTGTTVHALCWPLLLGPDGEKLGKSTGGRIWLAPGRTSPYQFFQHWMATDDRQVGEFLAKFTLLEMAEVEAIVAEHGRAPERRTGQRRLAIEATGLVHGTAQASTAEATARILFGGALEQADEATFAAIAGEVPTTPVAIDRVARGMEVVDLLVEIGACTSKGEARRLLDQGGISLNGVKVSADRRVEVADLRCGRYLLVRRGKADYRLVTAS